MDYTASHCEFSADRIFRYVLYRQFKHADTRAVAFVGLNPSTADEAKDDPTVRRCAGYAWAWGFDAFYMTNVCAFRATDPKNMQRASDPVGPDNLLWLNYVAQRVEKIICCWGNNKLTERAQNIAAIMQGKSNAYYLRLNANGTPAHPLYLPGNLVPVRYPVPGVSE